MPDNPYKGLMPYSEEDAAFFFGRDAEREIIGANLMASRLTLLYGPSGVGKSSVLRAGVAHSLRQIADQNVAERGTPEFVVVVFSSWRDDPVAGLAERVRDSVTSTLGRALLPPAPTGPLANTLGAWSEIAGGQLLVILDQFEEFFLYHGQEDGDGTFAVEFPRAVNRPDLRVNFLVSIREDALARLDHFKGRIPHLFDNYLRVEHLDRDAARSAIEKPIEQYNRLRSDDGGRMSVEPALVEAILDQVKAGQLMLGAGGRGVIAGAAGRTPSEDRIETPYLQLVLTRLWNEERSANSSVLRLETLRRLGGPERIVRTHLDGAMGALPMADQDAAARVFHHLVTPSGTKIAHTVPDLSVYAGVPEPQLEKVLDRLSEPEIRILRSVAPPPSLRESRYEIFHDVLAPAILDWRARYLQGKQLTNIRSLIKGWVISVLLSFLMLGIPLGAPIIVVVLRRARPPYSWKGSLLVGVAWIAGWFTALMIGGALMEFAPEFSRWIAESFGAYTNKAVSERPTETVMGFFILALGGILGPLAAGLAFWGLTRTRPRS